MNNRQSLQDPFLNMLRKERVPVSIFLVNGIKLQGQIESFDQFVVVLRNSVSQMVYKHAISTVVPSRNMKLPHSDETRHPRSDERRHPRSNETRSSRSGETGFPRSGETRHPREDHVRKEAESH